MPERTIDISRGFNVGQQMAAPGPLASFGGGLAGGLLDRFNLVQQAKQQALLEHNLRMKFDPEYRFKSQLFEKLGQQGGTAGGVDSNEFLRAYLGLPKSYERIQGEEQAKQTGQAQAPLSPIDMERMREIKMQEAGHAADIASRKKRFLGFQGTINDQDIAAAQAQYGNGVVAKIHAIRPDGRHVLIDRDKSGKAKQLGYTMLEE